MVSCATYIRILQIGEATPMPVTAPELSFAGGGRLGEGEKNSIYQQSRTAFRG